jgi:RNA polymerase sigma-70 factor, ECF subfamily
MASPDRTNIAATAAMAAGEAAAFGQLYDRLGAALLRVARVMLGSNAEADDAVQETFVNLARYRHRIAEARDLDAYVFGILRHAVHRRLKTAAAEQRQWKIMARSPRPEIHHEPDARIETALASLPPEQRQVIALKIDGDLTFAQIAEVLQISPNTVASRYRYALEKLRTLLEPWE